MLLTARDREAAHTLHLKEKLLAELTTCKVFRVIKVLPSRKETVSQYSGNQLKKNPPLIPLFQRGKTSIPLFEKEGLGEIFFARPRAIALRHSLKAGEETRTFYAASSFERVCFSSPSPIAMAEGWGEGKGLENIYKDSTSAETCEGST